VVSLVGLTAAEPQPDADGWMPWAGGECPVSPETVVDIRVLDGRVIPQRRADNCVWGHVGQAGFDIIAYRPASPAKHADDCPWDKTRITLHRTCTCGAATDPAQRDTDQLARLWAHVAEPVDPPRSLRDEFAMHALAGILAGGFADTIPHDDINGGRDAAFFALQYADAMMAARRPQLADALRAGEVGK